MFFLKHIDSICSNHKLQVNASERKFIHPETLEKYNHLYELIQSKLF
jgi:hypothetical protein